MQSSQHLFTMEAEHKRPRAPSARRVYRNEIGMPRIPAVLFTFLVAAPTALAQDDAFFERRIRPVLADTCFRCHGGERTSGKLRVDSRESLLKGGESGAAIVPGAADKSLLLRAI